MQRLGRWDDPATDGSPHRPLRRSRTLPERVHRRPYAGLGPQGEFLHHRGGGVSESAEQHVHIHETPGFNVGAAGQPPRCRNSLHSHRTAEVFFVPPGALAVLLGAPGHGGRGGPGRRRRLRHPHRHLPRLRERGGRLRDRHGHPRGRRRGRRGGLGATGDRGGEGATASCWPRPAGSTTRRRANACPAGVRADAAPHRGGARGLPGAAGRGDRARPHRALPGHGGARGDTPRGRHRRGFRRGRSCRRPPHSRSAGLRGRLPVAGLAAARAALLHAAP